MSNVFASSIVIVVNGSPLQANVMEMLEYVEVDQHSHLPGMFTIRLFDPSLELLDGGPFDLTKEVEIKAKHPESNTMYSWIKGEITSLEPEFSEGMIAHLVVRGYDKSHRLFRETRSQSYLNVKDSDLASQFAGSAGLSAQVEATTTVYDHIYQDNQSDLAFLMQRAWRIGYECFVSEGKLYFRKPLNSGSGSTLRWGETLVSFLPRMTLAEQVDEVTVKGWDVERQQAIVGQASRGNLYPQNGEAKNGGSWAGTFGTGKMVLVNHPVVSQAEANLLAQARLDELSGAFIEAEGEAYRSPDIQAGKLVKLEKLGSRFSGSYLVTQARHRFDKNGYWTTFTVRGSRTGMVQEQLNSQDSVQRWPGVVTAVVTNTDDPNDWGRVKVKFPWMTDDAETFWARVASPGAGPEAGLFMVPEVGDEVLVAFEHGDFNRPFVLGGLWNGQNAIPPEGKGASSGEKPLVRSWHSRTGHYMAMYDNTDNKVEIITVSGHTILMDDANKKVEILTSGGHKVTMDDQGKKLELASSGGHKVTMDDNGRKLTVSSTGDMEVKAGMNLKLQSSMNLDVQAGGILTLKGSLVKIN